MPPSAKLARPDHAKTRGPLAAGMTAQIAVLFAVSFLTKLSAAYSGVLVAGRSS